MSKLADVTSVVLLLVAAGAFAVGIFALTSKEDVTAVYWLVIGALSLRAATDMLRPKAGSR